MKGQATKLKTQRNAKGCLARRLALRALRELIARQKKIAIRSILDPSGTDIATRTPMMVTTLFFNRTGIPSFNQNQRKFLWNDQSNHDTTF